MKTNDNSSNEVKIDIAELNSYKKARCSIESNNTKPYDISKMTGKPLKQDKKE